MCLASNTTCCSAVVTKRRYCLCLIWLRCWQDEPTSGLDARAAAIVMRTVRNTVNTGRTVVCTIHQPSIDIFEVMSIVRPVLASCSRYQRLPTCRLMLCWSPEDRLWILRLVERIRVLRSKLGTQNLVKHKHIGVWDLESSAAPWLPAGL